MTPSAHIPFLARSCRLLSAGLLAALLGPVAWASDVIIVTDSRHPVQAPSGARVIELDRAAGIQAELAAGLPNDPTVAAALVKRRLADGGPALQRRIAAAYQDVVDAWSLSVTTIPAVVLDRKYVVYGEQGIERAIARIEAHRRAHP